MVSSKTRAFLLQYIKQIDFTSRKLASGILLADSLSKSLGQGLDFYQLKEYQDGDDIRLIDWKNSARTGVLMTKQYIEEKQRRVIFLIDCSESLNYSSCEKTKKDLINEIVTLISLAAEKSKSSVGFVGFSDRIEFSLSPATGRAHVFKFLTFVDKFKPISKKTDINTGLKYVLSKYRRNNLIFVISDFFANLNKNLLNRCALNNQVIAIKCLDFNESNFPDISALKIEDSETFEMLDFNNLSKNFFQENFNQWSKDQDTVFRQSGVPSLELFTNEDYFKKLIKFLKVL